MGILNFEQAKHNFLQRFERELSPHFLYHRIIHTRDDAVPATEMLVSKEGAQVIHFTHHGH